MFTIKKVFDSNKSSNNFKNINVLVIHTVVKVYLKEHYRGLYSSRLQFFLGSIPLLFLKSISVGFFSIISYSMLNLKTNDGKTFCEYFKIILSLIKYNFREKRFFHTEYYCRESYGDDAV